MPRFLTSTFGREPILACFALTILVVSTQGLWSTAAVAQDNDAAPVIAGYVQPPRLALGEEEAVTLGDERVFHWQRDNDGRWRVTAGASVANSQDLRALDGAFYLNVAGRWRLLTFTAGVEFEEIDAQTEQRLQAAASPAREEPVAEFISPIAATPIAVDVARGVVITDLGDISLRTMDFVRSEDRTAGAVRTDVGPYSTGDLLQDQIAAFRENPQQSSVTLRNLSIPLTVSRRFDASCPGSESFAIDAVMEGSTRRLMNRSCRLPIPVLVETKAGEQRPAIFLAANGEPSSVGTAGAAQLAQESRAAVSPTYHDGEQARLVRFDADMEPSQIVLFPMAITEPTGARIACGEDTCWLDIPAMQAAARWAADAPEASAAPAEYAVLRTERGAALAGSGWIELRTSGGSRRRVYLTSEGAASSCGWSSALSARLLVVRDDGLVPAWRGPAPCRTSDWSLLRALTGLASTRGRR